MNKDEKLEQESKQIKGAELKGERLVRVCRPNKKHYDYEWHDGENVDILPFKAEGYCSEGGLYFTTLEYLLHYVEASDYLGDFWFVTLTVDDDEEVWQELYGRWKAHRVMVTSMTRIKDMPEEVLYQMATSFLQMHFQQQYKPFDLAKREELWCKVVADKPYYLQFIQNQTFEMCLAAVRHNGAAIDFVIDPVIAVQLASRSDMIMFNISTWTCGLVDAFLASGQYTFKFQYCDDNGHIQKYKPEDLTKMLNLGETHDYHLCVDVMKNNSYLYRIFTFDLNQELVDHIYDKLYKKNNNINNNLSEEK